MTMGGMHTQKLYCTQQFKRSVHVLHWLLLHLQSIFFVFEQQFFSCQLFVGSPVSSVTRTVTEIALPHWPHNFHASLYFHKGSVILKRLNRMCRLSSVIYLHLSVYMRENINKDLSISSGLFRSLLNLFRCRMEAETTYLQIYLKMSRNSIYHLLTTEDPWLQRSQHVWPVAQTGCAVRELAWRKWPRGRRSSDVP
jgi:hypothetical protein